MTSPDRRRQAVQRLQDRFGVSERRACKVLGQPRSTQRYEPVPPDDEEERLRAWLRAFSRRRPRWGWRRARVELRSQGWKVNKKRLQRLWRDEGLQVPSRGRKRPLRGISGHVGAFCPIAPDTVWAMDFQFDQTSHGRRLKLFNVVDEFTREALAVEVEHNITGEDVAIVLDRLVALRGTAPRYVRFDHGPEFIADVMARWAANQATTCLFIDPGSPWQNAWIESFNGKLRDECLNIEQFDSLLEAKVVISDWRIDYNTSRPHSALDNLTPTEFHNQWTEHRSTLTNSHK